jgi:hypothetical protein
MNEPFELVVTYQGDQHEYKARFERYGYTHRIAVLIDGTTFFFEPDEEGGYRALAETQPFTVNTTLLQLVAEKLKNLSQ